jgi:tetratricopeptide (TPR) repeat protein
VASRPSVDLTAMREAMGGGPSATFFPSAASTAHFLKACLAHDLGNHERALDELRLAQASDESSAQLRVALAREYAHLGDLRRAEAQLTRVIEARPTDAAAQLLLGQVLLDGQKLTRAKLHLERAIELAPARPEAYLVLSQVLLSQGRADQAIKVIDRLGRALPGEPQGDRTLGLALAERGDARRAEPLLRRALTRDEGDLESWATLARIYEATERPAKALEAWARAARRDPENDEVLLSAGRAALRLGQIDEAAAWFDRLLASSSDPEAAGKVAFSYLAGHQPERAGEVLERFRHTGGEPRLHFYAGLAHERLGRYAEAAAAFEDVPSGSGELSLEARLHLAGCRSALGQHEQALELLGRLSAEQPRLGGLEVTSARALERSGQLAQAEASLVRAYRQAPSAQLAEALTAFYRRQGRLDEAVALFRAEVRTRPADDSVRLALAVALEKAGDWKAAVAVLADQSRSSPAAANFVGYTLAARGRQLDQALALVQRALAARPDDGAFLDSMGWVWFKRGNPDRALPYLLRAAETSGDEPTVLEHLGEVLLRVGRRAEARDRFRRAAQVLSADPDAAERPDQGLAIERRLKLLSVGAAAR